MTAELQPPLVSIALCTYNGVRFLREQIESLLAQDWPQFEIVAADDASTDGTRDILLEFAQRTSRIRVICNPTNLGFQMNFEAAIAQCRGRWIAPCDQDDIWLPSKLSTLAREMQSEDSTVLSYCDSEMIDEGGRSLGLKVSDVRNRFSTDDPVPFLFNNNVSGHAMLFCSSLLAQATPFPARLFHDWWIAYVAASAGRIRYVDECLVQHRQHGGNVTDLAGRHTAEAERPRGFRQRELEDIRDRIEHFSRVPGKGQALARELLALWRARETQFISGRLTAFVWRHRARLFAIHKDSRSKKMRKALQFFWGLRTKQLLEPHRYVKTN